MFNKKIKTPSTQPKTSQNIGQKTKVKRPKYCLTIFISVILSAILIGGGIYFVMTVMLENSKVELTGQINELEDEINQIKTQKEAKELADAKAAKEAATKAEQEQAYKGWATFTNDIGKYSFKLPGSWKAVKTENKEPQTLFGPEATPQTGLGGVEITEYIISADAGLQISLDQYLLDQERHSEIKYSDKQAIAVNDYDARRVRFTGESIQGHAVIIKKDNKIYNIYLNSLDDDNVNNFDKMIASFTFVK